MPFFRSYFVNNNEKEMLSKEEIRKVFDCRFKDTDLAIATLIGNPGFKIRTGFANYWYEED